MQCPFHNWPAWLTKGAFEKFVNDIFKNFKSLIYIDCDYLRLHGIFILKSFGLILLVEFKHVHLMFHAQNNNV